MVWSYDLRLLHGQGASLEEMIRKGFDAILMGIATGLFFDCTSKIKSDKPFNC